LMRSRKSVMIIAGEVSGDLHGANLVRAVRRQNASVRFFGIGGDRMADAGVRLHQHIHEMSFLGFVEVVRHLPFIRRVFRTMNALLDSEKPDLVILVDYPGFNLRFARDVKKRNIPLCYYISPQVWAWGRGRVKEMAELVDRMIVILPFEEEIYRDAGMDVHFVGHPLKDAIQVDMEKTPFFKETGLDPDKKTIGMLPGSRRQEVQRLLPPMMEAFRSIRRAIPGIQAVIGMSPALDAAEYEAIARRATDRPAMAAKHTYEVMAHSDALMVASGTATLEAALIGTPLVVLYKMSPLSYLMGRYLVKIRFISLINIIAGRQVVTELIQDRVTPGRIAEHMIPLLTDDKQRKAMRRELESVSGLLGEAGASGRAADLVLDMLA